MGHAKKTLSFMMMEKDSEYSLSTRVTLADSQTAAVSQASCALVLLAERAACDVDFEFRLQLALCGCEGRIANMS
jgi:hypothetical protein